MIDLSKAEDPVLLKPSEYYKIEEIEDRLFIPDPHVPFFK
jgi:hypothetical protein